MTLTDTPAQPDAAAQQQDSQQPTAWTLEELRRRHRAAARYSVQLVQRGTTLKVLAKGLTWEEAAALRNRLDYEQLNAIERETGYRRTRFGDPSFSIRIENAEECRGLMYRPAADFEQAPSAVHAV